MNFLHDFHPKSITFSVFGIDVYWYGIILVLAVIVGFIIALQLAKKKQVDTNHIYNLLFWLIVFGIIGGRLAHVVGDWSFYKTNLVNIVKVWEGGLAFYGVLSAGLVATFIYCRYKKISFWLLTDIMVVSLPLMQAIGRWGNYFNQELYGQPTDLPWGIPIDFVNRVAGFEAFKYFHPTFLYDSLMMLLVFIVLFSLFKSGKLTASQLTLLYLILFSIIRFGLDFLRIGMPKIEPLLMTQWLSIILFISAVLIWVVRFKVKKGEEPV